MDLLDLVVSVDTSVSHLAGAMGRPLWILVSYRSEWRYQLEREDCAWYPSARLFRQRAFGDWSNVVHDVRAALKQRFPELTAT
jgi:ADP-heptose:LPS heptosyltransferase